MRIENLIPLDDLRAAACATINEQAEAARMRIITPGSGQSKAYEQKLKEAELFFADPETPADQLPHLVFESELNRISIAEQAQLYLERDRQCASELFAIERKRLTAKAAVAEAKTAPDIASIVNKHAPQGD